MRTKKKLRIAILDTGIDLAQCPAVSIVQSRSFVNEHALEEKHGHGTLMFRILLQELKQTYIKVDSEFIIAQVMDQGGIGTVQQMCEALEWIQQFSPDLILIPSGFQNHSDLLHEVFKKIKSQMNCTVVAAAGNLYAGQEQALYPAAWPEVISVGVSIDNQDYQNWHTPPDVIINFSDFKKNTLATENISTSTACILYGVRWWLNKTFQIIQK